MERLNVTDEEEKKKKKQINIDEISNADTRVCKDEEVSRKKA